MHEGIARPFRAAVPAPHRLAGGVERPRSVHLGDLHLGGGLLRMLLNTPQRADEMLRYGVKLFSVTGRPTVPAARRARPSERLTLY
jgi:hypothetical protein